MKGSLIEGSLLYVLYYDGVYLRIRDTGWWPVYSSQTKFNFPYNEDWIYETLHIYLAGYDGLEHVRIHYTDGTTALYSNVGSGHIELNLDHTRTVDYALVEHVNWWFVRRISIDYIWISYYDPT